MKKKKKSPTGLPMIRYKGRWYTKYNNRYISTLRGTTKALNRSIWEDKYGELPRDMVVINKDGDADNIKLKNLEIIGLKKNLEISKEKRGTRKGTPHTYSYCVRMSDLHKKRLSKLPKRKVKCFGCNKEVKTVSKNRKYCTRSCYGKHKRRVLKAVKVMEENRTSKCTDFLHPSTVPHSNPTVQSYEQ